MKLQEGNTISGVKEKDINVKQEIARGGFGIVYLGEDENSERCILKQANIWNPEGEISENKDIIVKKLNIEREILDRVGTHPNIPTLLDYDEKISPPYLATEFFEGKNLYEYLREEVGSYTTLSEEEARDYTLKLADIVEYLHNLDKPVIHRDIKPANILVNSGDLNLIDFGSSVAGWEGLDVSGETRIFTAGYGAPEQEKGKEEVDVRTDIYGIGATLFFLLTGKDLRQESDSFQAAYNLKKPSRFNSSISPEMDDIVMTATQIFPEDRYQSVSDLKKALEGEKIIKPTKPTLQLGGIGHTVDIPVGDSIKIGRTRGLKGAKKDKDISINNEYVSDIHAKIIRDEYGYWVKDMYSLNGTAVFLHDRDKWNQLDRGQKWKLYSDDKIALGYNESKGPCMELIFHEPD